MAALFQKPKTPPVVDVPDRDSAEVVAAAELARRRAGLERGPQGTVLGKKTSDGGKLARAELMGS